MLLAIPTHSALQGLPTLVSLTNCLTYKYWNPILNSKTFDSVAMSSCPTHTRKEMQNSNEHKTWTNKQF